MQTSSYDEPGLLPALRPIEKAHLFNRCLSNVISSQASTYNSTHLGYLTVIDTAKHIHSCFLFEPSTSYYTAYLPTEKIHHKSET